MARSKKKNVQIRMVVALLAIASTVMVAFDSLKSNDIVMKGYQIVFGADILALGETSLAKIGFNVFALMAYFLPLAAAIIIFLVKGKLGALASAICLVISVVLLFILPGLISVEYALVGPSLDWSFMWGSIVAMVLAGLAAVGALYESYLELK